MPSFRVNLSSLKSNPSSHTAPTSDICLSCLDGLKCLTVAFSRLGWCLSLSERAVCNFSVRCLDLTCKLPLSKPLQSLDGWFHAAMLKFPFLCCHFFQKPWMIWGPVVAVALTAVTAAALFRTWRQLIQTHTSWTYICCQMARLALLIISALLIRRAHI